MGITQERMIKSIGVFMPPIATSMFNFFMLSLVNFMSCGLKGLQVTFTVFYIFLILHMGLPNFSMISKNSTNSKSMQRLLLHLFCFSSFHLYISRDYMSGALKYRAWLLEIFFLISLHERCEQGHHFSKNLEVKQCTHFTNCNFYM